MIEYEKKYQPLSNFLLIIGNKFHSVEEIFFIFFRSGNFCTKAACKLLELLRAFVIVNDNNK